MNSITGEQYTSAKIKLEQSILDSKKNNPLWLNKILDVLTVNYYIVNF